MLSGSTETTTILLENGADVNGYAATYDKERKR